MKYHYYNKCKSQFLLKHIAFTLAEVLITLGIIGIVAAMTIPTLITKYQKQVTINQLKVAYQIFSEAIQNAKLDQDSLDIGLRIPSETMKSGDPSRAISALFIDPYIKGAEQYTAKDHIYTYTPQKKAQSIYAMYSKSEDNYKPMCMPKGFCYWVINHSGNYTWLVVDLNGPKGPNVFGRDLFMFDIAKHYVLGVGRLYIDTVAPFDGNVNSLCSKSSDSRSNGRTCASKIINDGWKIDSDYPW